MSKQKYSQTAGIRVLQASKIPFSIHQYPFEEHGGTAHAAACLNVPEHAIIKTLVMETNERQPFLILMHGDRDVSLKQLARELNVKSVTPCAIPTAQKHTGYTVGGISPFGTRTSLPVNAEATIFSLEKIYINGGKRGLLVEMNPHDISKVLPVKEVHVAM